MRKIIPLFTSLVLLSGCALDKSHTFENRIKNSSIRPVVYSEKLKLNSANEVMFYSRISQTKGTREFFELVKKGASYEESYLNANGAWIEIGYGEKSTKDEYGLHESAETNENIIRVVARNTSKLSIWHNHNAFPDVNTKTTKTKIILPSTSDLAGLIYFYALCKEENKKAELDEGIVSRYGVTRFCLTPGGKKIINELVLSRKKSDGEMLERIIGSAYNENTSGILNCFNEISQSNPLLDKPCKVKTYHDLIEISFSPIEKE